ncbi:MAG TPA: hypothetical protein VMZ28_17670 [Kofleriaceae bacterium]|nr:hypothetical protein [Kofleriaceae bacterium]
MTLWRRRPALAVAIAIAVVAFLTPVAYAVVNKVFLSVDPDQTEQEIEEDVKRQLDEAGMPASSVHAEKSGDRLEIGIEAEGDHADIPDFDVEVRGGAEGKTESRERVDLGVTCELSQVQMRALVDLVSSDEFLSPLKAETSDGDTIAALREVLRRHGFTAAEVKVTDGKVSITITAPPA